MPKPPTADDLRQYAERQVAIESALAHYKAGIVAITAEINALESGLPSSVRTEEDAALVRDARVRIAQLEFDTFSLNSTIEQLQPEYTEVLAGPPDTEDES